MYEQTFRHGSTGSCIRPFSVAAEVTCRGYSLPLQRAIVDFAADVPFGQVTEKLHEHYGIEVAESSVRAITEGHAEEILEHAAIEVELPERAGVAQLIAEMDGSMIPIVETREEVDGAERVDRRKRKVLFWKEARLSLAHKPGSTQPVFGVTLEGVDEAGDQLANCAIKAGAGVETNMHCVGDGAKWIVEQVERKFGAQASYLIDFSHLCEYLAAAAEWMTGKDQWLTEQKQIIKENGIAEVVEKLKPYLESEAVADAQAPVRACYRYITNRPGQFNYKAAIEAELPIGSGEIESAHRYVIQKRLKIAGAWWRIENAAKMLALRALRANRDWEAYWQSQYRQAA